MPHALGMLVEAGFDVDEVALVQSRLDPQGARYETLQHGPSGEGPTTRAAGGTGERAK